jgi:hypothetical protein
MNFASQDLCVAASQGFGDVSPVCEAEHLSQRWALHFMHRHAPRVSVSPVLASVGGCSNSQILQQEARRSSCVHLTVAPTSQQKPLEDRIKELLGSAPVVLLMKGSPDEPRCGFSRKVVEALRKDSIPFKHFDILQVSTSSSVLCTCHTASACQRCCIFPRMLTSAEAVLCTGLCSVVFFDQL